VITVFIASVKLAGSATEKHLDEKTEIHSGGLENRGFQAKFATMDTS